MAFDPRAIANEILRLAWADGQNVTPMQLVKLTYIAHGWYLALEGKPLINQPVQAWKWGPVVPSVYREFKDFGKGPIESLAENWLTPYAILGDEPSEVDRAVSVIRRVWNSYKNLSGVQLSAITHQPGTPWAQVTNNGTDIGESKVIPDPLIKAHYIELKDRRRVGT